MSKEKNQRTKSNLKFIYQFWIKLSNKYFLTIKLYI
jgi:hypothetical protein